MKVLGIFGLSGCSDTTFDHGGQGLFRDDFPNELQCSGTVFLNCHHDRANENQEDVGNCCGNLHLD